MKRDHVTVYVCVFCDMKIYLRNSCSFERIKISLSNSFSIFLNIDDMGKRAMGF